MKKRKSAMERYTAERDALDVEIAAAQQLVTDLQSRKTTLTTHLRTIRRWQDVDALQGRGGFRLAPVGEPDPIDPGEL